MHVDFAASDDAFLDEEGPVFEEGGYDADELLREFELDQLDTDEVVVQSVEGFVQIDEGSDDDSFPLQSFVDVFA